MHCTPPVRASPSPSFTRPRVGWLVRISSPSLSLSRLPWVSFSMLRPLIPFLPRSDTPIHSNTSYLYLDLPIPLAVPSSPKNAETETDVTETEREETGTFYAPPTPTRRTVGRSRNIQGCCGTTRGLQPPCLSFRSSVPSHDAFYLWGACLVSPLSSPTPTAATSDLYLSYTRV